MSEHLSRLTLITGIISLQLMTSGCLGLGGGALGIFAFLGSGGGESHPGSNGFISLLRLGGGSGGLGGLGEAPFGSTEEASAESGSDSSGQGTHAPSAATIHNPEPSSLLLFGAGFAELSAARRCKKRRL